MKTTVDPVCRLLFLAILAGLFSFSNADAAPESRIQVLFLGDQGHHQPKARFRQLEPELSFRGITLVYTENMADLNPATLANYDCLAVYANIDRIAPDQEQAILDFVAAGKGFVPIHCASYCFHNSDKLIALTGAQFKSHGGGEVTTRIAEPDHPIMKGFEGFKSWDETYVHHRHNEVQRTVLSYRDNEPWTWVRTEGRGRVFYTAWGHDQRTWSNPGFHELMERGIRWAAGRDVVVSSDGRSPIQGLKPFAYKEAKVAFYPPGGRSGGGGPWNQMQLPVSAEESMKHMVVPKGFEVKLFAAEPQIRPPLAMAWDERGRLWLCESVNYPNNIKPEGQGDDSIRICEDTDGDGVADKFTVFAEGLNIPTSLIFANGGVIVHQAPHTLFLRDSDGDDKADVKDVLFTGWSKGDTHAGPSNLAYGLDNWIWGMQGYAGYRGTVGDREHRFSMGFYRFTPDGSRLEFVRSSNNNTWGFGMSEEGIIFGSTANGNPSMYMPIANRYYEGVRGWSAQRINSMAENARFNPISDKVRQVDWHGQYTAAAGHALYTARAYPREYWNRTAFVTGPSGKLIGTFILERNGADVTSRNPFNLVASDDEWTAPIMAEVGPDGMVWFIDWYNYIVQHNPTPVGYSRGPGNAYETDLRDKVHGRIYRLVYQGAKPQKAINLADASPEVLLAALSNDNMLWRRHAQRLLVERRRKDVRDSLLQLVRDKRTDALGLNVGGIHALWTLHGLGLLDGSDETALSAVYDALKHPSAGVRRNALQVLPVRTSSTELILASGVLHDGDAQVQLAALLALADQEAHEQAGLVLYDFLRRPEHVEDRWLRDAATAAAARHDAGFLRGVLNSSEGSRDSAKTKAKPVIDQSNLIRNASFEEIDDGKPVGWRPVIYGGPARHTVEDTFGHQGDRCLKITSTAGSDTSWTTDVRVKPNTRYRLSAWIKTKDLDKGSGAGAQLNLHQLQKVGMTKAISGNSDWTQVTSEFETQGNRSLSVNLLFGGWGRSKGAAWFDDIELIELGPARPTVAMGSLPEKAGEVVGIVTRHYAERGPTESVVPTLLALRGADPALTSFILDGLANGWPQGSKPTLTEADQAQLGALMNTLSPELKERLLTLADRWGDKNVFSGNIKSVLASMKSQLLDAGQSDAKRVDAARRLIGLSDQAGTIRTILDQINLQSGPELAAGLVASLSGSRQPEVGTALPEQWARLSPAARRSGVQVMLRRPEWTVAMLQGIEQGGIHKSDLNASEWQLLKLSKNPQVSALAGTLSTRSDADREEVFQRLLPALQVQGDVHRGKELFTLLCAQCHHIDGSGGQVGPELDGIGARPAREILSEIVDPNRSLESNFRLWTVETKDDESLAGRLDGESKTSIDLLDLTGRRHTIQRKDISSLTASDLSIMPVGLLDSLPEKDVSALLTYLTQAGHGKAAQAK